MRITAGQVAGWTFVLLAAASAYGQTTGPQATARRKATPPRSGPRAEPAAKPAAPPVARVEKPVPFRAGEVLTYDVSYSGALSAGEATITVRDKRSSYGSTAYYLVAEVKPTGLLARMYTLYYKADTLVDAFTLLPQRGSVFSLEGKRSRQKTTMFNHAAGTADYELKTAGLTRQPVKIAPLSQDALSVIVSLRTAPLHAGSRVTVPVCDGGRQHNVTLTTEGREVLKTSALTAPAWRLIVKVADDRGQQQGRPIYLWVSDDARRLPMKAKADLAVGSFVLELTKVVG